MMMKFVLGALFGVAACVPVMAHVTLETPQAAPDATYKAVLRVPHGCAGQPTQTVRVQIPDGLVDVKPMPKAGWTLSTSKGPYARPFDVSGKPVAEGVREVVWSGGSLPDDQYDEFVFRTYIAGVLAGTTVPVGVIQECGALSERWLEAAQPGQDSHALKSPAPLIKVAAKEALAPTEAFKAGSITIEQVWSRATPEGGKLAAGYMMITNTGDQPDRLVGGTFAAAGRFEVHESAIGTDGVMRMRPINGLEIGPRQTVELKPGGFHAMLLDLQRPLKAGESVNGTLTFEKAGTVAVRFVVRAVGEQDVGGHKH